MFSKINLYIFKSFFYSFLITFAIFAVLIFIGDFIEQFRKSTNKDVPLQIILQLTLLVFYSVDPDGGDDETNQKYCHLLLFFFVIRLFSFLSIC